MCPLSTLVLQSIVTLCNIEAQVGNSNIDACLRLPMIKPLFSFTPKNVKLAVWAEIFETGSDSG